MTLVLLPGLDGTDVFFQPLLTSLPTSVRAVVVCYPNDVAGGCRYADLLPIVRAAVSAIPDCHVLGWSFGGPLALMLAAAEPDKVRGVILSATFVRPPRACGRRLRFCLVAPVVWTYRAAVRLPLWLFRESADPWRLAKSATWARVSAAVVAGRMRAALGVDVRDLLCRCPQPVLYLAASDDAVVPARNVRDVVSARASVKVTTIAGRHLAMYTNPEAAARAIEAFISGSGSE